MNINYIFPVSSIWFLEWKIPKILETKKKSQMTTHPTFKKSYVFQFLTALLIYFSIYKLYMFTVYDMVLNLCIYH